MHNNKTPMPSQKCIFEKGLLMYELLVLPPAAECKRGA